MQVPEGRPADGEGTKDPTGPGATTLTARTASGESGAAASSMKFSTRSQYAIRLMVALARHYGGGPILLSELAPGRRVAAPLP